MLNSLGYDSGAVDGAFGPLTKAALIKFQVANGLVGDGIAGPLTRAALNK
ncbi:MAG: peptidoglycan-binding protein [Candidatus Pacebacteria bacterium]|nr:peptidoglycan-binding protein [Candidatus Paceibacterota bacterium]